MSKPYKILFISLSTVFVILLGLIGLLSAVIDPNDYKDDIIAAVKSKTGRTLSLDGELKFSFIPGIAIVADKLSLSNAPGFDERPFAAIEQAEIHLQLLPVLTKQLAIDGILLKGLDLNLAKNRQGVGNWQDLTAAKPEADKQSNGPAVSGEQQPVTEQKTQANFYLGTVKIENSRILWSDATTERRIEVKDLNFVSDPLTAGQAAGIQLSMTVSDEANASKHAVNCGTELTVNDQLGRFAFNTTQCETLTTGETIPGQSFAATAAATGIALDLSKQTVDIHGLQIKSGTLSLNAEMTANSIMDKPAFDGRIAILSFNPAEWMRLQSIKLSAMPDAKALSRLEADFDISGTGNALSLHNLKIALDDSNIGGFIDITSIKPPAVRFNLNIDAFDADRYLPPPSKPEKGIALAAPAVALAGALSSIPETMLKTLDAEGSVSLGTLKIRGLNIQDISFGLNAKDGVIGAQQSAKRLYDGSYSGKLNMDARNDIPAMATDETFNRIKIEPLLLDFKGEARLGGTVDASLQLQGQGKKADELKASLNGKLTFLCRNGAVKGFNLQRLIDQGKALFKNKPLQADYKNEQTLFSELRGTATIGNGLIRNDDLLAQSSKMRVEGKGELDLNTEAVNYRLDAKLLGKSEGQEAGTVKANAAINIAGTVDDPVFTLDLISLLSDKNKAKIDKLIQKLDKKLDGSVGGLLQRLLR